MSEGKSGGIDKWAKLRFSIIGGLLASPPERGRLREALGELAAKCWKHPIKEEWISFDVSTIERWYYQARRADNPIKELTRCPRSDMGKERSISPELLDALNDQYLSHPSWSFQLHAENLAARSFEGKISVPIPSYSTIVRIMKARGWHPRRRLPRNATDGQKQAYERKEKREIRGYESPYVHGLWHLDFHVCKRRVVDEQGNWYTPRAFCVLDDHSRLCCHIQWYLSESAQCLYHGLIQAFMKRGLPRAIMSDNGSAMLAHETRNGLESLGIMHQLTLSYSPYQNGKQESFWGNLEGRLMKMLEHQEPMTLEFLNRATQAWAELEYNKRKHREIGSSPLDRAVKDLGVARNCPDMETIKLAFCVQEERTQRRMDGTITINGIRFEIPSRFRHMSKLAIRYQSWDLSSANLVDSRTGHMMSRIYPQDKAANAGGFRKSLDPVQTVLPLPPSEPIPPLLRGYMADYAATGLPPAYMPLEESSKNEEDDHE